MPARSDEFVDQQEAVGPERRSRLLAEMLEPLDVMDGVGEELEFPLKETRAIETKMLFSKEEPKV